MIDKPNLMKSLSTLVEKAPEKLISVTDDELTERIETIMVIDATAGMLQDLTPEEMKVFEESAICCRHEPSHPGIKSQK